MGPTGVGKTTLSISLAKYLDASIISADSVQIYKEVNIASAKIREREKCDIPHYMLDVSPLDYSYTIFDYQKDGRTILSNLINQNKNVIIVGGSGLYIKALLYDYKLNDEQKTNNEYEDCTNEVLKEKVNKIYPENNIHVNNRKRLVRFLNSYEKDNKIIKNTEDRNKLLYEVTFIGLKTSNEILKSVINKRVDRMLNDGLLEEAKTNMKYKKSNSIIGYKEINKYFNNQITLEEAIEEIKKNTYKYSKRQYTWFNNQINNITWFTINQNNFDNTINEVINYLNLLP